MLIVMRIISSGACCSVTVIGASVIGDLWDTKEKGQAMSIYYLGPLAGPLLGPLLGGVLTQTWNWRATQWFLAIYGSATLLAILLFVPETQRHDCVKNSRGQRPSNGGQAHSRRWLTRTSPSTLIPTLNKLLIDPLRIVTYLRFPAITCVIYFASTSYAILIMLAISLQETFSAAPYRFSLIIVGVTFLPMSTGMIIGSIAGGRWSDYIMDREGKAAGRYDEKGIIIHRPEDRMRENAWLSIVLFPGALLWYGWTAEKGVLWVVPVRIHPESLFVPPPSPPPSTPLKNSGGHFESRI